MQWGGGYGYSAGHAGTVTEHTGYPWSRGTELHWATAGWGYAALSHAA